MYGAPGPEVGRGAETGGVAGGMGLGVSCTGGRRVGKTVGVGVGLASGITTAVVRQWLLMPLRPSLEAGPQPSEVVVRTAKPPMTARERAVTSVVATTRRDNLLLNRWIRIVRYSLMSANRLNDQVGYVSWDSIACARQQDVEVRHSV